MPVDRPKCRAPRNNAGRHSRSLPDALARLVASRQVAGELPVDVRLGTAASAPARGWPSCAVSGLVPAPAALPGASQVPSLARRRSTTAIAAAATASRAVPATTLGQRRRGLTSTRRAVTTNTSQIFGAMVSLIARPLRSMRGAVQARAPLTRGVAHVAALLAPRRVSCSTRPRMSAASATVTSPRAFPVGLAPGVASGTAGPSARQRDSLQAPVSLSAPGHWHSHCA